MKRLILTSIITVMILMASICFGQSRNSTDRLAADALICTDRCVLYGLLVETDGTNNATVIIYDGTSATGKILRKIIVPGANFYGGFELPVGLRVCHRIVCGCKRNRGGLLGNMGEIMNRILFIMILIGIVVFSPVAYLWAENSSTNPDCIIVAGLIIGSNIWGQDASLGGTPESNLVLLESGDFLLKEDGDKIVKE